MSRGNTSRRSGALAIFEFLLLIACYVLPAYIWLGDSAPTYLFYDNGMNADVFTAGSLIALMYFQGLYRAHRRVGMDMVLRLTTAMGVGFVLEGAIFFVVLTIGMAVDANVLIYERLREELAKGKSLRGAIAAGYARAFGTIFDSHVTTLICSVATCRP